MPQHHSKTHKRVETVEVSDEPHDNYYTVEPYTGKSIRGVPIPSSGSRGQVLRKSVTYKVNYCPECDVAARYSVDEEPVCPRCGLIVGGNGKVRDGQLVRDHKAAGRAVGNQQ